jgi:hypothetical protein
MKTVELKFVNTFEDYDKPLVEIIHCSKASVAPIMSYYGAFYAGDPYTVYIDGIEQEKDMNGQVPAKEIELCASVI